MNRTHWQRKKMKTSLCALALCISMAGGQIIGSTDGGFKKAQAAESTTEQSVLPITVDNLTTGFIKESAIAATNDGYMRVFVADRNGEEVYAEYYDSNFQILSRKTIPMELSYYGGFYAGADAYYLIFGANNEIEKYETEVIRVVKYDKDWNRIKVASIYGDSQFAHEIGYPFTAGTLDAEEYDGYLYIATGHRGYVDPDYNQGHQGLLMLKVDEAEMTGSILTADLWHSFTQHISIEDNENIYLLEESDGDRCTKLSRYTSSGSKKAGLHIMDYGGSRTSAWSIPTYTTVDGMEFSSSNILTVGTSIDQERYSDETYTKTYNAYLTVTPKESFTQDATTLTWLTDDGTSRLFQGMKLVKISDDRFLVLYEKQYGSQGDSISEDASDEPLSDHTLYYQFFDGNGTPIGQEYTASAAISECAPIVKGSKVVYYASSGADLVFYSIDTATGAFEKKAYSLAGENAIWEYSDKTLTISGTGAVLKNFSSNLPASIQENVEKIIIKEGITDIPTSAFSYLKSLNEVILEDGVTSIGEKAFYGNEALKYITIPDSVTSIADNAFDTGYYWIGSNDPVINVKIRCSDDSYAASYAETKSISHETIEKATPSPTIAPVPTLDASPGDQSVDPEETADMGSAQPVNPGETASTSSAQPVSPGETFDTSSARPINPGATFGTSSARPVNPGATFDTSSARPVNPGTTSDTSSARPVSPGETAGTNPFQPVDPGVASDTSSARPVSPGETAGTNPFQPVDPGAASDTSSARPVSPGETAGTNPFQPVDPGAAPDTSSARPVSPGETTGTDPGWPANPAETAGTIVYPDQPVNPSSPGDDLRPDQPMDNVTISPGTVDGESGGTPGSESIWQTTVPQMTTFTPATERPNLTSSQPYYLMATVVPQTTSNPASTGALHQEPTASANAGQMTSGSICTITLKNGDETVKTLSVKYGETYGTLPIGSKRGYLFLGWYTQPTGGSKVTSTTRATGNATIYAQWEKVTVGKPRISRKKAGRRMFTVRWTSSLDAEGYQIRYSRKKSMAGSKKKTAYATSQSVYGLKAKKKYYVQVRAYQYDSQFKKVYSAWSNKVKVKIKK